MAASKESDILDSKFYKPADVFFPAYNNVGLTFDDVTLAAGLGVETRYVGWGAGMADFDNDGLPDLFVATGGIFPEVARKLPQYPMNTPRAIFRGLGNGRFEELLVGRVETAMTQIEVRGQAAAALINSRVEQLSQTFFTSTPAPS